MQSLQQQQQPQLLSKQISPQFDFSDCNHQSVSDFLNHCHLNQYLDVFLSEGFDSVTSLLEITEEDMIFMNVKRGHRRLIQREIATTKGIPRDQPLITNMMGAKYPTDVIHSPTTTATTTTTNQKIPMNNNNSSYSNNSLMKLNNESSHSNHGGYETGLTSPRSMNSGIGGSGSSSSSSGSITTLRSRFQQQQPQQPTEKPGFLSNDSAHSSSTDNLTTNNSQVAVISDNRSNSISSNDDNDSIDTNESAPSKRKYRRHAKPDRHAPIKPPSAYIMFSNDARAELKNQNLSFAELAKIVGDQWKNLSHHEKQAYERMAMRAKDEYLASLEQYRQTPQYNRYQEYLNDFKSKQDAANRLIGRARKRAKQTSPGSGSIADSSSNGNSNGSGSSGSGSTDAYGDKDTVMRRQRVPSDSESPENGDQHEYELGKPARPHRQQQQSSDSGYTSQSYYNNNQQQPTEQSWNFRSNQIMRGMLPVEFVHTTEKNKEQQQQDELLEDESQYDSTKRRSPRFYKTTTS